MIKGTCFICGEVCALDIYCHSKCAIAYSDYKSKLIKEKIAKEKEGKKVDWKKPLIKDKSFYSSPLTFLKEAPLKNE